MVTLRPGRSSGHALFAGALLLSLCVIVGVLTPYLSVVACVYALVNLFGSNTPMDELMFSSLILNAVALAFLGPGAYSVDARLFGRRVVVVAPRKDSNLI
jgi:uncharacterized membrane protein YphA (DoxX/SURF4 family)